MGSRLKKVVEDRPKPMALINNKPFLEYLLNYLAAQKITHVILSVGYKADLIKNHFGNNFKRLQLSYAQEKQPLGTGGGIKLALEKSKSDKVFIINGDTFFSIELETLADFHSAKNSDLTVALKNMKDGSRYGSIQINDEKRIVGFHEKKEGACNILINGGIYLLNKNQFLNKNFPDKFSFEKDYIENEVSSKNFYGLEFDNYFIDIGLPSSYKKAQTDFLNGIIEG